MSSLTALASGYFEGEGELHWVVKFAPLEDERNLRVPTQTVLSYEGCENTLCPVVTESKSPFKATGCNYRGVQCLFQWIVHYLVTVLSEQRQLCECKSSVSEQIQSTDFSLTESFCQIKLSLRSYLRLYVSKNNQIVLSDLKNLVRYLVIT